GFVRHGHASGSLTLTSAKGSVTLALTGPDLRGFSALPARFEYAVTGGTGAYARVTGHGTLSLLLAARPSGAESAPAHGSFALVVGELGGRAGLDGALAGHVTAEAANRDAGTVYDLTGAGVLAGRGHVSVSGWLRSTGFVQGGHATGVLTVTGPHGS